MRYSARGRVTTTTTTMSPSCRTRTPSSTPPSAAAPPAVTSSMTSRLLLLLLLKLLPTRSSYQRNKSSARWSRGSTYVHALRTHAAVQTIYIYIYIYIYTGWARKVRPQTLDHNSVRSGPFFVTGKFLRKFVVKLIVKLPSHLAYIRPRETLVSAKQTVTDKLQGIVWPTLYTGDDKMRASYSVLLRYGG